MRRIVTALLTGGLVSLLFAMVGTLKEEEGLFVAWPGDIGKWALQAGIIAIAIVLVLAVASWILKVDSRIRYGALVIGILSILTVAVFFLGLSIVLGSAAIALGLEARRRGGVAIGTAAVVLGLLGSVLQAFVNVAG